MICTRDNDAVRRVIFVTVVTSSELNLADAVAPRQLRSAILPLNMEYATMKKNHAPLTAGDCWQKAHECLREANKAYAEPRAAWLEMAERWLEMADTIRFAQPQARTA